MDPEHGADAEKALVEGLDRLEAGDLAGAAARFLEAVALEPEAPEAWANLGVALERAGDPAGAREAYLEALERAPGQLDHHLNLGSLLVDQGRLEEAEAVYAEARRRFPQQPALWCNLGVLEACRGRLKAAEACLRRALDLDPSHAKSRFNLGYVLLRQGRLEEGWPALEARPWSLDLEARVPAPRWRGEPLEGRSLLVGSEGGLGDMIQFARYLTLLKARGAGRVGLVVHPALGRLLEGLAGLDVLVRLGETIRDDWDLWTLPLSLPGLCGTRTGAIPAPIPYLAPRPELVQAWGERLPRDRPRIGLAWRGNPRFENDGARSLPSLDLLEPLARPGRRFVSLQKGPGEAEALRPLPGLDLWDAAPWIEDLADLAALMIHLDLVVSVDTAAAHLAGALGRPCRVLLPAHKPDWRWFTGRDDSPWYPTLRLFRQVPGEDWSGPVARLARDLGDF